MAIVRSSALIKHKPAIIQAQERQLDLIHFQLPQVGHGVGFIPDAQADQLIEHGLDVAMFMVDRRSRAGL